MMTGTRRVLNMSEIAKSLRDHVCNDHTRGCQGREYSCKCGYDQTTESFLNKGADEIDRLEGVNRRAKKINDELAIEANGLRAQLASAKKAIDAMCDHLEAADPFGDHVTRNELQAWRDLLTSGKAVSDEKEEK
jgi:hypothetical protein